MAIHPIYSPPIDSSPMGTNKMASRTLLSEVVEEGKDKEEMEPMLNESAMEENDSDRVTKIKALATDEDDVSTTANVTRKKSRFSIFKKRGGAGKKLKTKSSIDITSEKQFVDRAISAQQLILSETSSNSTHSATDPPSDHENFTDTDMLIKAALSIQAANKVVPTDCLKAPPDQYGQEHPIESPELIAYKLNEFDDEIDRLDPKKKVQLTLAQEQCLELLTPAFKLRFLRCDTYDAKRAAIRFARYWEQRVTIFGLDTAFKPLTMQNCLQEEDFKLFHLGHVRELIIGGRVCRYLDMSRVRKGLVNTESALRFQFYFTEAQLDHEIMQKKGLFVFTQMKGLKSAEYDRELNRKVFMSSLHGQPVRLSCCHTFHAPRFFSLIYIAISPLLSEKIRKRIFFHYGSDEQILAKLVNLGMSSEEIPTDLGGSGTYDMVSWYKRRLAAGL